MNGAILLMSVQLFVLCIRIVKSIITRALFP